MSERESSAVDPRLLESEERYRAVIENASDMIQSVRPDGTFEFVNPAWIRVMGYDEDDVARIDIWDIIHPDSVEHCRVLFSQAIAGFPIGHMEALFVTKAGEPLPVEGNVTSRKVGDSVVATHGFFRDISERLRAKELEERNLRLEREQQARYLEKMAALGKLSAGLAHELNNPAAAVQRASAGLGSSIQACEAAMHELIQHGFGPDEWQGFEALISRFRMSDAERMDTDLIGEGEREAAIEAWLERYGIQQAWMIAPAFAQAGVDEEQLDRLVNLVPQEAMQAAISWLKETLSIQESIGIIGRSSSRISELVQAVKGYTHMDRATEQHVNIHEGLENTLIILGHRLRNITVRRAYDREMPPVRVFGNTLNQVWTNILDNAIDATDSKGTVSIRTRRDDGLAVVEIEDDGTGIAPDDLACIFEPFFTTKAQGVGTGLGLDTAWRIVTEEHGGALEAESEPGRTVFRVSIPLATE